MLIDQNSVVTFHYRLRDEIERPIKDSYAGDPPVYLYGHGGLIRGLEKSMRGRSKGEKFKVCVTPIEGYGLRNENLKQRIPIKYLSDAKKSGLRPGQTVTIETRSGHRRVRILKVGKFNVDVDGNHPLAGKTLNFEIEIVDVREATPEEIAHGHVHGIGGHDH